MLILFAAIGVGYICKKVDVMDEDFDRKMSKLVLNATLPALILSSVLAADELPDAITILEVMGLAIVSFCFRQQSPTLL